MSRSARLLSIATVVALATVGFALPADASAKFSFHGGSMLTIEYHDPIDPSSAESARVGIIKKSGRVKLISGDLNLYQVTDADYDPRTGRVYVLASGYTPPCEVWSFNPARVNRTLRFESTVAPDGVSDELTSGCGALSVYNGNAWVTFATASGNFIEFFSIGSSFDPGLQWEVPEWYSSYEIYRSGGYSVAMMSDVLTFWSDPDVGEGSVTLHPMEPEANVQSLQFDGRRTMWIAAWLADGIKLGSVNQSNGAVSWGSLLTNPGDTSPWLTDTIAYVPRRALR